MNLFERRLFQSLLEASIQALQTPMSIEAEALRIRRIYLRNKPYENLKKIRDKADQATTYLKIPHEISFGLAVASENPDISYQSEQMLQYIDTVFDPSLDKARKTIESWAIQHGWSPSGIWDILAEPEDPYEREYSY